jgi:hypothetical protein
MTRGLARVIRAVVSHVTGFTFHLREGRHSTCFLVEFHQRLPTFHLPTYPRANRCYKSGPPAPHRDVLRLPLSNEATFIAVHRRPRSTLADSPCSSAPLDTDPTSSTPFDRLRSPFEGYPCYSTAEKERISAPRVLHRPIELLSVHLRPPLALHLASSRRSTASRRRIESGCRIISSIYREFGKFDEKEHTFE